MKLKDYLSERNLTVSSFAEQHGLEISTVSRAASGKVVPSEPTLKVIFKATDGLVTPNDFYELDENSGPAQPEYAA